jgi:hypothetical protein
MERNSATADSAAAERLAGEVADVRASIALVEGGVASRITLTGTRFGRQVVAQLAPLAGRNVHLEASIWPEDDACDITITREGAPADAANGGTTESAAGPERHARG